MVALDAYTSIGLALELLSHSPYHRKKQVGEYFRAEVLPAVRTGQVKFYLSREGRPVAMISWAWITEAAEQEIHTTGRALKQDEWRCGDRMFINDWISPHVDARIHVRDMMWNVFPDIDYATSIRRKADGSVRRVNRWRRGSATRQVVRKALA